MNNTFFYAILAGAWFLCMLYVQPSQYYFFDTYPQSEEIPQTPQVEPSVLEQDEPENWEAIMNAQAEKERQHLQELDQKFDIYRKVSHNGYPNTDPIQELVQYAYTLGGGDFLLTLEGENGLWKWDRKSQLVGKNGYRDYGLCQLNGQYHGPFIFANGVNMHAGYSKKFQNPKKQIEYCHEVWQDAEKKNRLETTFYAYNTRYKLVPRFTFTH